MANTKPTIAQLLKYADLQMAAEAFLIAPDNSTSYEGKRLEDKLVRGNNHNSKFTEEQAAKFAEHWIAIDQMANKPTGFSGTLFQCIVADPTTGAKAGEFVISFRSTEFIDDAVRDNLATNTMEVKDTGFAWGQIADMEEWYETIKSKIKGPLSVTGYSLGGHLATAFHLLHSNVEQVVTFNGAGVGKIRNKPDLASALQFFSDLRAHPDKIEQLLSGSAQEIFHQINEKLTNKTWSVADAQAALDAARVVPGGTPQEGADLALLGDMLRQIKSLQDTVVRVASLHSGAKKDSQPDKVEDSAIGAEDFSYRLAVHFASLNSFSASMLSGAIQALGHKSYLDQAATTTNQFDVKGDTSPSMVSNSQWHLGEDMPVFIEDQPLFRGGYAFDVIKASLDSGSVELLVNGYANKDFGDTHSLVLLQDSLNTQNALLNLVGSGERTASETLVNQILKSASNLRKVDGDLFSGLGQGSAEGDVLENVVNGLAGMLLGTAHYKDLKGSPDGNTWAEPADIGKYSGRTKFYNTLYAVTGSAEYQALAAAGTLQLIAPPADLSTIRSNLSALLSLVYLTPFAFKGDTANATLLKSNLELGSKWRQDNALSDADRKTGKATLTDDYLSRRASFAAHLLYYNDLNAQYDTSGQAQKGDTEATMFDGEDIVWTDATDELKIQRGSSTTASTRYVSFGGDDNDASLLSGAGDDSLYGGAGGDSLEGKDGSDHLEGNDGDDNLNGGAGSDVLWGGAGMDTYVFKSGDGKDSVLDADGDGKLLVNGKALSGGEAVPGETSIWTGADGVRYAISKQNGKQTLRILYGANDSIVIADYKDGSFGLTLTEGKVKTNPVPEIANTVDQPVTGSPDYYFGDVASSWTGTTQNDWIGGDGPASEQDQGINAHWITDENDGADIIMGYAQTDHIFVSDGNDLITGESGNDTIWTGDGNSEIYAGEKVNFAEGKQPVFGDAVSGTKQEISVGDGNNTVVGGTGNDKIVVGRGNNLVYLGPGQNTFMGGTRGYYTLGPWYKEFDTSLHFESAGYVGPTPVHYHGTLIAGEAAGVGNDTVFGGKGDSTYYLSNGDNELFAGSGNDVIQGGLGKNIIMTGAGNDLVLGGGGVNWIDAEGGNDLIIAQGGTNQIFAGSGNSTIYGGLTSNWADSTPDAVNFIYGGTGNTVIWGSGGKDVIWGGSGNDSISAGNGDTIVHGGSGANQIVGGAGTNVIYAGDGGMPGNRTLIDAGKGNTTIFGGSGIDLIKGGSGKNVIYSGDGGTLGNPTGVVVGTGETTVYGGAGALYIAGGSGANVIYAGDGGTAQAATTIHIGSGSTTVYGGAGIDWIQGGATAALIYAGDGGTTEARTTVQAGSGADTIVAGGGFMYFTHGSGQTTYVINGNSGDVVIADSSGTLKFGPDVTPESVSVSAELLDGSPALVLLAGRARVVVADGLSGGAMHLEFEGHGSMSITDLMADPFSSLSVDEGSNGLLIVGAGGNRDLVGGAREDTLIGYNGNNTLTAGTGDNILIAHGTGNTLRGGGGNSKMFGGDGNDTLIAGSGNDTLHGGAGGALLEGGTGNAHMFAGTGHDTLVSGTGNATMVGGTGGAAFKIDTSAAIVLAQPGVDNTLTASVSFDLPDNINSLVFTGSGDVVGRGNTGTSTLTGNTGNATLYGGVGNDTLIGGSGNSELHAGGGNQLLTGGGGSSVLFGGQGADTLVAGSGASTLYGGTGYSLLQGGSGADLLVGGYGASTLVAGHGGNDTLIGGSGNAVYRISAGIGSVTLTAGSGINTIEFGADLAAAGVSAHQRINGDGSKDLILVLNDAGDQLTILNGMAQTIEHFNFANGDSLDTRALIAAKCADPLSLLAQGTAVLTGGAGNDTLDGGAGYSTLQGGTGIDSYILRRTGGIATVMEAAGANSIVALDAGIALSDIAVQRSGSDLYVGVRDTPALVIFKGYYSNGQSVSVLTADGQSATVQSLAEAAAKALTDADKFAVLANAYGVAARLYMRPSSYVVDSPQAYLSLQVTDLSDGGYATHGFARYLYGSQWDESNSTTTFKDVYSAPGSERIMSTVEGATESSSQSSTGAKSVTSKTTTVVMTPEPQPPKMVFLSGDDLVGQGSGALVPPGAIPQYRTVDRHDGTGPHDELTGYMVAQPQAPTYKQETVTTESTSTVDAKFQVSTTVTAIEHIIGAANTQSIGIATHHQAVQAGPGNVLVSTGADQFASVHEELLSFYSDNTPAYRFGTLLAAGSGSDTIIGGLAPDTLVTGGGDSFFNGLGGPDTYHVLGGKRGWSVLFDSGVGSETSAEASPAPSAASAGGVSLPGQETPAFRMVELPPSPPPSDTVFFEAGIALSDLKFSWGVFKGEAVRQTLNISWADDTGVRIPVALAGDTDGWGIERFKFADGTTLSMAQMIALAPPKPAMPDQAVTLVKAPADQVLDASKAFSYVLPAHAFLGSGTVNALAYTFSQADGQPLPAWLTFDGATRALSSVSSPDANGLLPVRVRATASDGSTADAVFNIEVKNAAPPMFAFGPGIGATTIGRNTVEINFASGIAAADVKVARIGTDLILAHVNGVDSVRVSGWFENAGLMPGTSASFADGTVWSAAALTADGLKVVDTLGGKTLTGLAGFANILVSGPNDTLIGGSGNDTFEVNAGMGTIEITAKGGANALQFGASLAPPSEPFDLFLPPSFFPPSVNESLEVRNGKLVLHYGSGNAAVLNGFDAGNAAAAPHIDKFIRTDGSSYAYADLIGKGFDIYAQPGDTSITGTNLVNRLWAGATGVKMVGSGVSDEMHGGAGIDTMVGGVGRETYVVNNSADVILASGLASDNKVHTSVSYALPAGTSDLSAIGGGIGAMTLTGNELDNVIFGGNGNDALIGGAGNDTLNGAYGNDRLAGGPGNDTYAVDSAGDTVIEQAGEGIDTITSGIALILPANVEVLKMVGFGAINGTGNALDNLLFGNDKANVLNGGGGHDILLGGGGNDVLLDTAGNNLFDGGSGADSLTGGAGNDLFAGGSQNDTIITGTGADVIAFDKGDGQDLVKESGSSDNTISLGMGILYADLKLQKSGDNLVLIAGAGDQLTLENWYLGDDNHSVGNLQVIVEGSAAYAPASQNVLINKKVSNFDFAGLVSAFDAARAADPTLTTWALSQSMLTFFLASSDNAAIGGDLAYLYGTRGSLADTSMTPALSTLSSSGFGRDGQSWLGATQRLDGSQRLTTGTGDARLMG